MPSANRWVVTYKRGRVTQPWLIIDSVPPEITRVQVLEALEGWSGWQRFSVAPGASTALRRVRDDESIGRWVMERRSWGQIQPQTRAIRVDVPGATHAAMTRAARGSGLSLQAWGLKVLTAAVGAE
jgi:hypothetical protein